MNEWIIAPLLAVDPTGLPTHRLADKPAESDEGAGNEAERRSGERREDHRGQTDDDFGRGEDRRGDLV